MDGRERVLRAVSKMENFGVRKVIPPRFPIFERTSSPPSEKPEGSRPFGYRGFLFTILVDLGGYSFLKFSSKPQKQT